MLSSVQNLNFNFTHQTELDYARRNASDANTLLLQMQNATSSATLQYKQVSKSAATVTGIQDNLASQQRGIAALRDEVRRQQSQLDIARGNITAIKVSSLIVVKII